MAKKKKEDLFAWNDAIRQMNKPKMPEQQLEAGDYCWFRWEEGGEWFIGEVEGDETVRCLKDNIEHPTYILDKIIKINKPE